MLIKNKLLLFNITLLLSIIILYIINNICNKNILNYKKDLDNNMIINLNMTKKINHLLQKTKLCGKLLESFDDCGQSSSSDRLFEGRPVSSGGSTSHSKCSQECLNNDMESSCCDHTFPPNDEQ